MDSRTAAHVLAQIGGLLELHGEDRFKSRAYHAAARAVLGTDTDDITPLYKSGEGVAIARKGWLEKSDVLNCGAASEVLSHARRHRA